MKNETLIIDNLIGFLFINGLSEVIRYKEEIEKKIEDRKLSSLVFICSANSSLSDTNWEERVDVCRWIRHLPIPTIALLKDSPVDMLELFMNCDIRLLEENTVLQFPESEDEFTFNFIEQCQLLMGKDRYTSYYKALLSSTLSSEEAHKLRLINEVIGEGDLTKNIKSYIESILADRSENQIKAIMKCISNYKIHGINSERELLLEEESRQFCQLILKEYEKSRVSNES